MRIVIGLVLQMTLMELIVLTMTRHIIVQDTRPQIPDFMGDISTTRSKMLIRTRIKTTNIPILPGYTVGGTRKLNQLTMTMIMVGI